MLTREVFERADDFRIRVAEARFRHYEWQFLADLDGRATVGEILMRLGLEESTMGAFIERQIESGSIVPSFLTYEEFTRSQRETSRQDGVEPQGEPTSSAIQSDTGSSREAPLEPPRTRAPLVFTLSGSAKRRPQNGHNSA